MAAVTSSHLDKPNENDEIYRYMGFSKFQSMLFNKTLHFHQAANLGDDFEGSIPEDVYDARKEEYENSDLEPHAHTAHEQINRGLRKFTYLSCWHNKDKESLAMWDQYGGSDSSVAIKSTIGSFEDALALSERDIYLSNVSYRKYKSGHEKDGQSPDPSDFDDEFFWTRGASSLFPFIYKRNGFSYEEEVRAIIQNPPIDNGRDDTLYEEDGEEYRIDVRMQTAEDANYLDMTAEPESTGYDADVFLDDLIEKVYIGPDAGDWFNDVVKEALQESGAIGDRDVDNVVVNSIMDDEHEALF